MAFSCCLGLDLELSDILETDCESIHDTNCYLEQPRTSQGTYMTHLI